MKAASVSDEHKATCVPLFTEMDPRGIVISRPIASASKGHGPTSFNMFVGASNRQPFRFQMSLPGPDHRNKLVFAPDTPVNGGSKVSLALSVPTLDDAVMDFWAKVDDVVIAHTAKHSKEFLKREMTEDAVRSIYTPSIRVKEDYDNFLKVRFDTAPDSRCCVSMFDVNEHKKRYSALHHSRLEQGDSVTCIVQLGMVYFFNQKVGITVDISHLTRYAPPPANEFPFQLGAEYQQCVPEDLFRDDTAAVGVAITDSVVVASPTLKPVEDIDATVGGNDQDDGSTVKIDPVTLLPIDSVAPTGHKRPTDAVEEDVSRPKRKR